MRIIKLDLRVCNYADKSWYIDWHKNELCHREDGPATIWVDGDEFYYLNAKLYFKDNYWKKVYENY